MAAVESVVGVADTASMKLPLTVLALPKITIKL